MMSNYTASSDFWKVVYFYLELAIFNQISTKGARGLDLPALIKHLKTLDDKDAPNAWELYKKDIRARFAERESTRKQPEGTLVASLLSNLSSVASRLFAKGVGVGSNNDQLVQASNLADVIELTAKSRREYLMKQIDRIDKQVADARKKQQEQALASLENMKKNNAKLIDYMMGAQNPPKE